MLSEGAKPGTPQIQPSRIYGDSMELKIVVSNNCHAHSDRRKSQEPSRQYGAQIMGGGVKKNCIARSDKRKSRVNKSWLLDLTTHWLIDGIKNPFLDWLIDLTSHFLIDWFNKSFLDWLIWQVIDWYINWLIKQVIKNELLNLPSFLQLQCLALNVFFLLFV